MGAAHDPDADPTMAKKTIPSSDWDASTRRRGLTLLLQGMLLLAMWAGATLLAWGIETALFGPESFPWLAVWAGVSGVVIMLAGVFMGLTGVAIDKITVPSWLNPENNWLLWQILVFLLCLLAIYVYLRFF